MLDIVVILIRSIVTVIRLMKPGGLRAVVAESALTRHQILIPNRSRKRAPNLRASDRLIAGLCTLLMHPSRLLRSAYLVLVDVYAEGQGNLLGNSRTTPGRVTSFHFHDGIDQFSRRPLRTRPTSALG
jgi:hypothetical protein